MEPFVLRFLVTSVLAVCGVWYAIHAWRNAREDPPPTFDFGGALSVVALRASSGKYLEVSRDDGMLRATAEAPTSEAARFRVHVLSAATVSALKLAASSTAVWSEASSATFARTTAAGCSCSGFSNEHGFGRFCHSWETDEQTPWCYVDALCKDASKGSFGRQHADCRQPWESPEGAGNSSDWQSEWPAADTRDSVWAAPRGCPCSGVRSSLGFGDSCKAWEYDGQTPWC
jgi:hypothetical protein